MTRPDGGRSAAKGFEYQYLRTLEALLDLSDAPDVWEVRIEGQTTGDNDVVDFDVWSGARVALMTQVKSRPGGEMSAPEAMRILLRLTERTDADRYELSTNATPSAGAVALCHVLDAAPPADEDLRKRLLETVTLSAALTARIETLGVPQLGRLRRCRLRFDAHDSYEFREELRERIRGYRDPRSVETGPWSPHRRTADRRDHR